MTLHGTLAYAGAHRVKCVLDEGRSYAVTG